LRAWFFLLLQAIEVVLAPMLTFVIRQPSIRCMTGLHSHHLAKVLGHYRIVEQIGAGRHGSGVSRTR